jgi:hypothetical protein
MVVPAPYERKPVASQWYRAWRALPELPAKGSCITVCRYARRPTHFYTFNHAELESEKNQFFAVAAEGCIHCLRQQYFDDPHLLHAMSADRQYTALDYAIWEAQKHPEDARFDAVLDFLLKAGCRSNYYKNRYVHSDAASRSSSSSGTYSGRTAREPSP